VLQIIESYEKLQRSEISQGRTRTSETWKLHIFVEGEVTMSLLPNKKGVQNWT